MKSILAEMLHMQGEPVGVWWLDEAPQDALVPKGGKRVCVADVMVAALRGKKVVLDDETCTCAGGAVGLGFGDAFVRRHHSYRYLLSYGEAAVPEGEEVKLPPHMREGERFFKDPDTVQKWKDALPFADRTDKKVLFAPASLWEEGKLPELVVLFLTADQLSAVVSMGGFRNGKPCETIAPYGAACHSLLYALDQEGREDPKMVMGFFDVSQRPKLDKSLLTLTMPYAKFAQLEQDAPCGCLSSHAWGQLCERHGF